MSRIIVFHAHPIEQRTAKSISSFRPQGNPRDLTPSRGAAAANSPALQRRVKCNLRASPGGTTAGAHLVSTRTFPQFA
jgi:hypothetical protein